VGRVGRLLGEAGLVRRAEQLLREAPDDYFWAGVITNIPLPWTVPEGMRSVPALAEVERRHPGYSESVTLDRVRGDANSLPSLARCLEGRIEEACASAGGDLGIEEIAATLAILGDFDGAARVLRERALPPFRHNNVLLILAVERFHRNDVARAG